MSYRDGDYKVYVMNADGSEQTRLSSVDDGDTDPNWSPDGSKIVFSTYRNGIPDSRSDSYIDAGAHSHDRSDTDAHAYPVAYSYPGTRGYSNDYAHTVADSYANADAHTHPYTDAHANTDTCSNAYAGAGGRADRFPFQPGRQ